MRTQAFPETLKLRRSDLFKLSLGIFANFPPPGPSQIYLNPLNFNVLQPNEASIPFSRSNPPVSDQYLKRAQKSTRPPHAQRYGTVKST